MSNIEDIDLPGDKIISLEIREDGTAVQLEPLIVNSANRSPDYMTIKTIQCFNDDLNGPKAFGNHLPRLPGHWLTGVFTFNKAGCP